jgi:uncharacterized protein (DUF2252 family)
MSSADHDTNVSVPPSVETAAAHERGATRGRALRKRVPRSAHGDWVPPPNRTAPLTLLASQEKTRLPDLVELRHERMFESPFAFYRGAALVMAADLANGPTTGLSVQACGDAHLSNFGGFAAPDRTMVFDMNDFDETNPGPFEWDVKRLAASFEIASRSREFAPATTRAIVLQSASAYREWMARFARMSNIEVWYARFDTESVLKQWRGQVSAKAEARFFRSVEKARGKDSVAALSKLTRLVDGKYQFASDPPILVPLAELSPSIGGDDLQGWLRERIRLYARSLQPDRRALLESYEPVDFARKVVGVGSVGTRCWVGLFFGRDHNDPLILQIKEAEPSVVERYGMKSQYVSHGQRVVEGQRLLQAASDTLLGWVRAEGLDGVTRDFYVRQLWDWKLSPNIDTMRPQGMDVYAQLCGATLARGHARSGDRFAIAAYLGSGDVFDRAIADFASSYADQAECDYQAALRQKQAPVRPKLATPAPG